MATGMWTAAAGAVAQSQNLDVIANNLANSDTLGFKKDMPTFKEYLSVLEREHGPQDIPRKAMQDKDFYPLEGRDQAYVIMDGTHTSYRQGPLRVTSGQLDIALDGNGFLEIKTPTGIRYTRQGSLKVLPDGTLVTSEGNPVLGQPVSSLASQGSAGVGKIPDGARTINLKDQGPHFSITEQGEIFSGDELIAKLNIAEFKDLSKLKKVGGWLFENPDPQNRMNSSHTIVRQGVLETSNVNPAEEMTRMIMANRLFEQDLKALKTYGEMMGREANDVGKL